MILALTILTTITAFVLLISAAFNGNGFALSLGLLLLVFSLYIVVTNVAEEPAEPETTEQVEVNE